MDELESEYSRPVRNYLKFQRKYNSKCVQLCGCANLSKLVSFKVLGFSNFSHKVNVDFIIKPAHTNSSAHTYTPRCR